MTTEPCRCVYPERCFCPPEARRSFVTVRYDVTGLTPGEVDALTGEALVQAERSDGHPGVEVELVEDAS